MSGHMIGTWLDLWVMVGYFVAVVCFGLYFGKYASTTKDFFFGGQRFAWWLIAFSGIATTVGSYSFVKYSAAGFQYGLSSTQSYMNDWFWMPLLLLVWLPIIYFQRIKSVPEYFERRFGRGARIAATVFILMYLIGYVGINLLTLGTALEAMLGLNIYAGAFIACITVTLYVMAGGQTSVIMTDLVQGITLLIVGLALFLVGVHYFGGFGDFWGLLDTDHRHLFSRFAEPDSFSFVGIYGQDGLANTGAFVLMNQGMMMRFLSLRSVKDARRMAVCWILVLAPIAAITVSGAGWIGWGLMERGDITAERMAATDPITGQTGMNLNFRTVAEPGMTPEELAQHKEEAAAHWRKRSEWMTEPSKDWKALSGGVFVVAANFLCAPGIFGLVLAALMAALMSTADSLINAVSAVFVNDIYRPYFKKEGEDRHYLRVARIASLLSAAVGMLLVPIFNQSGTIYSAHGMFTAAVTPPIVVAIFLGVLWKRFNSPAALVTMIGGGLLVLLTMFPPFDAWFVGPFSFGMGEGSYKFTRALYGLAVSGVLGVIMALLTKPQPVAKIIGLVNGTQLDAMRLFKGGEINRKPGKKPRATVTLDTDLVGEDATLVPQAALEAMAADVGDLIYVCDRRWWFGGLRSVHSKIAGISPDETVHLSQVCVDTAHFKKDAVVYIEKIC